jgi:hypothetical protein
MIITKDFSFKLFFYLSFGFIIFTVIGTLSHELGHYMMAVALGYDASINYGYTHWSIPHYSSFVTHYYHGELITLAGPLQTIFTGSIGFIFLFRKRKNIDLTGELDHTQWLFIFLTLFWLRELFNFLTGIPGGFAHWGDEETLALNRNLPILSFILPLALIAYLVLNYVYFRFVPYKQRLTFLTAGLAGGLLGFYLWMYKLGPILMP